MRGSHQETTAGPDTTTATDTATLLEDAADRIADVSRADLQITLRRAALRLRNAGAASMEDDAEDALRDLAGELDMTRNDTIRFIVREWMETNTYLPVHELDEDGDVDGTACSR
ncbi:CopG family transcriptional regulator [Rhizobium johnstonii]|uniref:CopG family transcriptional regulator n=1 Tax=Rhizobium johnstonii TaxID=3019933 RepID=UPI003F98A95E